MVKLRTTINPTEELDVDDAEAADLKAMGLVLDGTKATTDDGLIAAATRQVRGRSTGSNTDDTAAGDGANTQES